MGHSSRKKDRAQQHPTEAGEGAVDFEPAFIFSLGSINARYPSLGIEKEVAQAQRAIDTSGMTDSQAFHAVLSEPGNGYLARQLCWVLSVEGLEAYILRPRTTDDYALLVETIREQPKPTDVDVVIGRRGPIAPASVCNGVQVPIVTVDHVYSFDRDDLISALPRPDGISDDEFGAAAAEVLDRIMQLADNVGATDEHRALNYLAVRYPAIYHYTAEAFETNSSLVSVDVRPSRLSGARNIVDVILSYRNRVSDAPRQVFTRVDVTEEFPFLVTKLSPFFER